MPLVVKISRGVNSGRKLNDEYELLSKLDHPSIPKVYDIYTNDLTESSYLIMEYFDGVELGDVLSQQLEMRLILK